MISFDVLVLEELLANHVAEGVLGAASPAIAATVMPCLQGHPRHGVGLVNVGALPDGHGRAGAHHEGEQEMHGERSCLDLGSYQEERELASG